MEFVLFVVGAAGWGAAVALGVLVYGLVQHNRDLEAELDRRDRDARRWRESAACLEQTVQSLCSCADDTQF